MNDASNAAPGAGAAGPNLGGALAGVLEKLRHGDVTLALDDAINITNTPLRRGIV